MTSWRKEGIEIADGTKVMAQMPVIVSASRSTDTLAAPILNGAWSG